MTKDSLIQFGKEMKQIREEGLFLIHSLMIIIKMILTLMVTSVQISLNQREEFINGQVEITRESDSWENFQTEEDNYSNIRDSLGKI